MKRRAQRGSSLLLSSLIFSVLDRRASVFAYGNFCPGPLSQRATIAFIGHK